MIELDALCMADRKSAHAYIAEKITFPEYYGKNLDALHDCLTELGETEITVINSEVEGTYFEKVKRVMIASARENEDLHITFK